MTAMIGQLAGRPPAGPAAREAARQILAEEAIGRHHVVGRADALAQQVAEARPDRLAHEQCAGQHRHRGGDAGDHGHVRAPVVQEVAQQQPGHRLTARCRRASFSLYRVPIRSARSRLWVTTMRIVR